MCEFCHAAMWYDERVDLSKNTHIPKFNLCCKKDLISLPTQKSTPQFLKKLLDPDGGTRSLKFNEQIRIYNSMFQFISIGGVVDNSINQVAGAYVFKLSSQNYQRLGSLLLMIVQKPKFAQLYMIESDVELNYRMSNFIENENAQGIDNKVVCGLRDMLNVCYAIVKIFYQLKRCKNNSKNCCQNQVTCKSRT